MEPLVRMTLSSDGWRGVPETGSSGLGSTAIAAGVARFTGPRPEATSPAVGRESWVGRGWGAGRACGAGCACGAARNRPGGPGGGQGPGLGPGMGPGGGRRRGGGGGG
ncbi:hypothetical protein [Williamsia sp.]|uniref:hypothetical protein n=1 Tax=Williamsia sp. TaxID=1872085 RepID=UPI002F946945